MIHCTFYYHLMNFQHRLWTRRFEFCILNEMEGNYSYKHGDSGLSDFSSLISMWIFCN